MRSPECRQMGLEKSGNASHKCRPVRPRVGNSRPSRYEWPRTRALHSAPELVELGEAILWLIACDDAGVDCANRCADNPIRFDLRLVQRLVYANLISSEGSAALENKHYLSARPCAEFVNRFLNHCFGHAAHGGLRNVHNCLERGHALPISVRR